MQTAETPKRTQQPKDFTLSQVAALQPFLPALLRRYGEVAEKGETDRPDPVCAKVAAGHCYECPVFGDEVRADGHFEVTKKGEQRWVPNDWHHCEELGFWPPVPLGVTDSTKSVRCGKDPDRQRSGKDGSPKATMRERAQAYGLEMVARLERLKEAQA